MGDLLKVRNKQIGFELETSNRFYNISNLETRLEYIYIYITNSHYQNY